jgi:F-type H+-transporting ATPase subunit a
MTSLLASLALSLAVGQHAAAPAPSPSTQSEAVEHRAPNAPAPEHGAAATQEGSHAAAAEHGAKHESALEEYEEETEKREASLSDVMLGHVSDGYVLEYPGICHGGFSWECETNLRKVFGKSLVFDVGGSTLDMTPTKHLVMMWFASIVLLVVVFLAVAKRNLVPRGLYNFIELLVQFVRNEIAKKNIGEHDGDRFVPFLVTAFFFILFVNLFGLVPWAATATGNVAVTLALAAFTFLITQYAAIRAQGLGGWLKHLTGGVHPLLWPIMIPVEILGLFTKPFALTIRLFANMIAGHIVILSLLGLIFALGSPLVAVGSVPMALAIFALELFVAFVQAYIFTMLSSLFIGQGLVHHGGHDEEHAHGGEPGMGHAPDHASHASHGAGTAPGHG